MSFTLNALTLTINGTNYTTRAFIGHEQINRPYSFRIEFYSTSTVSPASLLNKSCHFQIVLGTGARSGTRAVDGLVLEAGRLDSDTNQQLYYVVIGPALALRNLSRRSQVYAGSGQSLTTILQGKLGPDNSGQSYEEAKAAVQNRFAFNLTYPLDGDTASGSMTVQYQETDLTYISRLCEAAGVFYYIEHAALNAVLTSGVDPETVVFADNTANALPSATLVYTRATPGSPAADWVWSFQSSTRLTPKKYAVHGVFDYGTTFDDSAPATVAASGVGTVVEYVATYDFQAQGLSALAQTRAYELSERMTLYTGQSSCVTLAAASRFTLTDGPFGASTQYFVETVDHAYGTMTGKNAPAGQAAEYRNSFTCVVASANYRPPRLLQKPVLAGVFHARVESSTTTVTQAELNATGRYHIHLRFDEAPISSTTSGRHSGEIRLATPYGGTNGVGMHFPLLSGTEVLVAFQNGDPDRPIIVATVATKDNISPVTNTNPTRYRIVNPSGMIIELDQGT